MEVRTKWIDKYERLYVVSKHSGCSVIPKYDGHSRVRFRLRPSRHVNLFRVSLICTTHLNHDSLILLTLNIFGVQEALQLRWYTISLFQDCFHHTSIVFHLVHCCTFTFIIPLVLNVWFPYLINYIQNTVVYFVSYEHNSSKGCTHNPNNLDGDHTHSGVFFGAPRSFSYATPCISPFYPFPSTPPATVARHFWEWNNASFHTETSNR